ncbi:MAG: DUF427 domain-containing protein [Cryomorphaceae bacterium]|nr:DUF427 domain-containing protein [Flavobacteriales bacterium]
MKAVWNNQVIAESDDTIIIENNHYFPHDSIKEDYFSESNHHTVCPWKGTASYYHISVDGKKNENAAWYYPETKKMADGFKNYVAFWRGVEVAD